MRNEYLESSKRSKEATINQSKNLLSDDLSHAHSHHCDEEVNPGDDFQSKMKHEEVTYEMTIFKL